jgi:hypothetical protein
VVAVLRSFNNHFGWQRGIAQSTIRLQFCEDAKYCGRKVCWSQNKADLVVLKKL